MNLKEFIEKSKEDSDLFWRLQSGEHQNLLDEAIERIYKLENNQAMVLIPNDIWIKIEKKAKECQKNWGMGFPVISITLLKTMLKS